MDSNAAESGNGGCHQDKQTVAFAASSGCRVFLFPWRAAATKRKAASLKAIE